MDQRIRTLLQHGEALFSKRTTLMSLWQEIAEHFYPERADFTATRTLGEDFARHLTTSYPLLARRELGNSFSAMLRPTQKDWFKLGTGDDLEEDIGARAWLEWAAKTMRRAMYDRQSGFTRATKEGDHDYAAFGQCVLSAEVNHDAVALLYRCHHLRDVVWTEGKDGLVETVHRKWRPSARELVDTFGAKVSSKIRDKLRDDPYCEIDVRHVVLPSAHYEGPKRRQRFVSVYFEADSGNVLEEIGINTPRYIIPRWQTVSGSQYAHSPATVAALPDARLIQSITLTLLNAGQKMVDPPLLAVQEAIRSDIDILPGGVTWIDREYDERLGEVLRPLVQDKSGMPLGMEMQQDVRAMIQEAFFLNTLRPVPMAGPERTAYEVGQLVQDYIRRAMPLFEPIEADYSGALCEATFDLLMEQGAFGPPDQIPPPLRGQNIQFRFESPLHDAIEAQKGQTLMQTKALLAEAMALDPSVGSMLDVRTSLRDALKGIGTPAAWTRDDRAMDQIAQARAEEAQVQQMLGTMQQGADVAKTIGEASTALAPLDAAA